MLWDILIADVHAAVQAQLDGRCGVLIGLLDVIVVTNQFCLGMVSAHRSGVLFRDLLCAINQRVAAVCDEVHLVVAGRVLQLEGSATNIDATAATTVVV
nr:bifunctional adenosylcobinamide kinase/adenosylcobinamide-phosphate guanylyltransferase [Mycobacterium uberis]